MPVGLPGLLEEGRKVTKARVYNTFNWPVRSATNAPQRVERYQRGNNPVVCCMTGFSRPNDREAGYIFTHTEDYTRPLWWHPISRLTHRLLHARFYEPRRWFDWVAQHYVHGAWFTMLSMNPLKQWPGEGRDFSFIYPSSLPNYDQNWPDYADQMGLSRELFLSTDLRDPIRALWRMPVRDLADRGGVISPPRRRAPVQRVAPVY